MHLCDTLSPRLSPEVEKTALGKSIAASIKGGYIIMRDKRFMAARRVERHVRHLKKLPLITIYAPYADATTMNTRQARPVLIRLGVELEQRPQWYVNAVVAHELAHVVLGHMNYGGLPESAIEPTADALAAHWGFRDSRPITTGDETAASAAGDSHE